MACLVSEDKPFLNDDFGSLFLRGFYSDSLNILFSNYEIYKLFIKTTERTNFSHLIFSVHQNCNITRTYYDVSINKTLN